MISEIKFSIFIALCQRMAFFSNLTWFTKLFGLPPGFFAKNEYGRYFVPRATSHRPAARKILQGAIHEPQTLTFLSKHTGLGDVIHAGTYFGDFLPALSKSASKDAWIWAFEPSWENYLCAMITIRINALNNVRLFHAGLGYSEEEKYIETINEKGERLGGASKIKEFKTNPSAERCKMYSIDRLIPAERPVSILQLDVEGYELEVLKGAIQTVRSHKPVLILEDLNEAANSNWFADNILALGYKMTGKLHKNSVFQIVDAAGAM